METLCEGVEFHGEESDVDGENEGVEEETHGCVDAFTSFA